MTNQEYEYGIDSHLLSVFEGEHAHRDRLTQEEAEHWVARWREDGGKDNFFRVIRRPLGAWEPVDD